MLLRIARIAACALLLPVLFMWSQQIAAARGQEPVPGIALALAAVSALFLVRAAVTEWTQGREANLQKDLLWGLGAGGFLTILLRWL